MTVIVNTIWVGRVCQVVDRQISKATIDGRQVEVVDTTSTKVCVALCSNALISIAYTGVAVAHQQWMDTMIASCLAHRPLSEAMIQPGIPGLGRPVHTVIHELSLNLNGRLNSDARARNEDVRISVVGWHLGRRHTALAWELRRGTRQTNGLRYFEIVRHPLGKFLRAQPSGLWVESLGNAGATVDDRLRALGQSTGFTHDDVERYVRDAIISRAAETATVGRAVLAVQLDPFDRDGHVQFTSYPDTDDTAPPLLQSGWTLTRTMVCSPSTSSTLGASCSPCGRYITGGYGDAGVNLQVRTRLPANIVHLGGPSVITFGTQRRSVAP